MKVRMSEDARAYLRNEGKYLRARSTAGAGAPSVAVRKARENLASFRELG